MDRPFHRAVLGLTLMFLAGCVGGASRVPGAAGAPAWAGGLVIHGGAIYVDAWAEPTDALVVVEGRVAAVGSAREILPLARAEGLRELDLQGAVAVPGLMDGHGHVLNLGRMLDSIDLVGTRSYEEVVERVAARAATLPAGTWLLGRGWDQTRWENAVFPHHAALSAALPDHPVLITRVDGHAALANERALELAGLIGGQEVPSPEGGQIVRDDSGNPTGVLIDTAIGLVRDRLPAETHDTKRALILAAQERLLGCGLVAVHDMGLSPSDVDALEELEREGALELRVIGYLWGNDGIAPEVAARFPRAGDEDPARHLRVIGAKLMMDGALGSRGAALFDEYSDDPGNAGLLRMSAAEFRARLDSAVDAGLQPATHAIGDRANRIVLDAYARRAEEDSGFRALRPRVEHAQVVAPEDWRRFEALDVVPSMQPTHATSDMRWAEARLGPERVKGAYAWRRLLARPSQHAFGSDFPVERPDPLEGLYAARTRRDQAGQPTGGWQPGQCLDARQALAAFTSGVARAAREEDQRGRLVPGCFADLTVLDRDPIAAQPEELLSTRVLMTIIDGVVVFAAQ